MLDTSTATARGKWGKRSKRRAPTSFRFRTGRAAPSRGPSPRRSLRRKRSAQAGGERQLSRRPLAPVTAFDKDVVGAIRKADRQPATWGSTRSRWCVRFGSRSRRDRRAPQRAGQDSFHKKQKSNRSSGNLRHKAIDETKRWRRTARSPTIRSSAAKIRCRSRPISTSSRSIPRRPAIEKEIMEVDAVLISRGLPGTTARAALADRPCAAMRPRPIRRVGIGRARCLRVQPAGRPGDGAGS